VAHSSNAIIRPSMRNTRQKREIGVGLTLKLRWQKTH